MGAYVRNKSVNCRRRTTGNGKDAVKLAESKKPNLVLMDIMIHGDFDGIATAGYIYRHYNIPVVYLTANSDQNTFNRAKATSPFGFVLKPFEERELQITIEMALYRHMAEEKIRNNQIYLTTLLRCMGDGIVATNAEGVVQLVNQAAERILGCKSTDIIYKSVMETLNISDSRGTNKTEKFLKEATNAGEIIDISGNYISPISGKAKSRVLGALTMVTNDDKINLGYIIAFREVDTDKTNLLEASTAEKIPS